MDWQIYFQLLIVIGVIASFSWLLSLAKNDVSMVDSLWSLMFLAITSGYYLLSGNSGSRAILILTLVGIWSIRLSAFITIRNHGEPEDYRYQQIRRNNEPGFRFKSLYIVFGLQGMLAWVIAMPLAVAAGGKATLGWLDLAGVGLWCLGMFFEVVGDAQLARFKNNPENRTKVLTSGLWRFTRHPNYFGEFALWWGFYLLAAGTGGWWTIASPLLMTFLLLRVSGVRLLEKDIGLRRPEYARYIKQTNTFFPGPQKQST